ncbi:4527_t:CDS:2, partial [Dentiscutata heterogama]
ADTLVCMIVAHSISSEMSVASSSLMDPSQLAINFSKDNNLRNISKI